MRHALVVIGAALLAGCSAAPSADRAERAPDPLRDTLREAATARPDDCLLVVWSDQDRTDAGFDRAHDSVDGGAISCATGTSASQFDAAIAGLREAAASGDKRRMLEQVGLPMLFIDADGNRRELRDRAEVEAAFDDVFDARMLATLQKLDLAAMSVEKGRGGYFELGALWLTVDAAGGRPRLVTVNRQALDEAAAAARDQASRNQGRTIPFDQS